MIAPVERSSRFARLRFRLPSPLWFIALGWFALTLWAVLWVWGLDPLVFPTPDESVVRFGAQLIGEHHPPYLELPIADPEDLFHPRGWVTIGNRAWPSFAPVGFYVYGYILRLGKLGLVLIAALPAGAVAAFSAGVGNLLPRPRQWLAALAPLLAFPATYWLLRPWANVSPLLIGCAWCVFFWSRWRVTEQTGALAASALALAFGVSVRPDCAAFAYIVMLLVSLAASPARWRPIFVVLGVSGLLAVGANLVLNKVITGHALRAAYQIATERQWGAESAPSVPGLGLVRSLFFPMGLPTWSIFTPCFDKYWVRMGPIALVTLGQLAIVPIFWRSARKVQLLVALAVIAVVAFCVSRMHYDLFGGAIKDGEYHHSVPRYLTPVYLIAALPPLLWVGRTQRRWLAALGSVLLVGGAASAGYELWSHQSASLNYVKGYVEEKEWTLERVDSRLPRDATVYTFAEDKWIWSRFRVASMAQVDPSLNSMERALGAGLRVFVLQPHPSPKLRRLTFALKRRGLRLARVDRRRGIYRVLRIEPTETPEPVEPAGPPEPPAPKSVGPSEPDE